jgi:hypothetical protein
LRRFLRQHPKEKCVDQVAPVRGGPLASLNSLDGEPATAKPYRLATWNWHDKFVRVGAINQMMERRKTGSSFAVCCVTAAFAFASQASAFLTNF